MIKCPYCAEEIQDDAVKCRFCNEFILKSDKQKTKWYFSTAGIVIALLAIGPLALPLIWFHPNYKQTTKITLTIVIIGISLLIYFVMSNLYLNLMEKLETLELN